MKKEDLLRALGDVGEDLLHMAEHKKFYNQWKRWASLAACLALVIGLGIWSLPHLGTSMKESEAAAEAPMESPTMDCVVEESAVEDYEYKTEEAPMEEEILEEEVPAEVQNEAAGTKAKQVTQFVVCGTWYYVRSEVTITEEPREIGDYLGQITEADDESLVGCAVYKELYSAEFSNYAVDGQVVTQNVYVKTADGWLYAMTANEKVLSRYTTWDIEDAFFNGDKQWIIQTFVQPVENQQVDLFEGRTDSDHYNRLFLASLQLNTGVTVDFPWVQEDFSLLVHPDDVVQRLSRFVDEVVDYVPEETENYDPESGMLHFTEEEVSRYFEGLYLKRVSVEDDRVWLWVGLPETDDLYDEKMYELRFDEDSWRYIHISTPG